jgi:hypothetical protein
MANVNKGVIDDASVLHIVKSLNPLYAYVFGVINSSGLVAGLHPLSHSEVKVDRGVGGTNLASLAKIDPAET